MSENIYAVLGLKRKRGELAGHILGLERQLKDLKGDLAALDRSLCLLDPSIQPAKIKPIRPVKRYRYFKSGELIPMLYAIFRKASGPMLNHELVKAVLAEKGLDNTQPDTRHAVDNRVRAALQRMELKKTVTKTGAGKGSTWSMASQP